MKTTYERPEVKIIDASSQVRKMLLEWDKKQLRTEFIKFEILYQDPNKKTMDIHVFSKNDLRLGSITWHAPWRKYTFQPRDNMQLIFDDHCMHEIAYFIEMLMLSRKIERGDIK